MAQCVACGRELESLRTTVSLLHRVPMVSAPRSFALAEVKPRLRRALFAVASAATAFAASAMVFFFAGNAFGMFNSHAVVEEGLKLGDGMDGTTATTVPPTALNTDMLVAPTTGEWPVWQIEVALIGAVIVLSAVTFILWRRIKRRSAVARAGVH